jgi:hypothetical protein
MAVDTDRKADDDASVEVRGRQITNPSGRSLASPREYRPAVKTITCDCGSKVPIPDDPSASQTVTTPCLKCKTYWVFHYDADGRFQNFCQKGGE